ncbi:MAG: helix-turn-helix domain-containing protein [Candidatus Dormibacteria bacterium]
MNTSILSVAPDHRLLTIAQACTALGVSRPTLAELRRQGRVPFVRIGSRGVRIPTDAVAEFIAANVEQEPRVALAPPRRRARSGGVVSARAARDEPPR